MTIRLTENYLNATGGISRTIPSTDSLGRLLAMDGSQLTGLPSANVNIENDFDSFKVIVANSNITAEGGVLYLVESSCTINMPSPIFTGEKIGFIIVNTGVTLTLVTNVSSGGTALRTIISGLAYGNSVANNDYYQGLAGTTTYTLTGAGKSLYFIGKKTNDAGLGYPVWIERSSRKVRSDNSSGNATGPSTNSFRGDGITGSAHVTPNVLNFVATSNFISLYTGSGNTVLTATTTTQGGNCNTPDTLNSARGFRQQFYFITAGLGSSSGTNRTATMNFSVNSNANFWSKHSNFLVRWDGKAETLTAGYGTGTSLSYNFSDSNTRTYQSLKLSDGSLTRATHAFDWFSDRTGVQQITSLFGSEYYYSNSLQKWFLVRHYSKV